ncbi:MAG: Holliday junction resolvase RuvX [Pseudomonadota bacterium]
MIYNDLKQLNQDLPRKGRLLGLDVGTKTIGVAVCDGDWLVANPKLTIARKGGKTDFLVIQKIIEENKIVGIVVGLPLNMDESESAMSEFVRRFADSLDEFLSGAKIVFFDERLSSFAAEELLESGEAKNNKRKGLVDQIAASVILQGAIDLMNSQ